MPAKSITEETQAEKIVDDVLNETIAPSSQEAVDLNKLAALKAKNQAKQQEQKMASKIVGKKERSIEFGIIGSGQGGSRLAQEFYKLGYSTVVMNTALADLKFIELPDSNKLLLNYSLGGAAKELSIGHAAASQYRVEITQLINEQLSNSQVNILCLSLGGGSGAGSAETLVDVLSDVGKPLVVMCILPMHNEDSQTKQNSLETLSKLTALTKSKKIHNLIVVDNAKLEDIYQNVSQMDFFQISNKAIVSPIDIFNTLSAMPSSVKPLDSMEFAKLFTDGEALSTFGEITISNYLEDTAIAEGIVSNLDGNLLASGFDLTTSKYVGVLILANAEVWKKIPSSSINYAMAMINDKCGSPRAVFKGIYTTDMQEDVVKVISMFSGMSLPEARISQLKKETKELAQAVKGKEEQRNLSLNLDTGKNETISAAEKVREKIATKNSAFGKLVGGVVDRRK